MGYCLSLYSIQLWAISLNPEPKPKTKKFGFGFGLEVWSLGVCRPGSMGLLLCHMVHGPFEGLGFRRAIVMHGHPL